MKGPLDSLRTAVAIATSRHKICKSKYHRKAAGRKTAHWLDETFFLMLRHLDTDYLVECGAHEASASVRFVKDGGKKALAIEANPITFATRTKVAERQSGVTAVNLGVASKPGHLDFHIPQENSLDGSASFLRKPGVEYRSERVPVDTLDNIAGRYFSEPGRMALWVDVEGLAGEVLGSGSSLLSSPQCIALKVEVESNPFWGGQELGSQLVQSLSELGFTPVLRDIEYDSQFNIVFLRTSLVEALDEFILGAWSRLGGTRLAVIEDVRLSFKHMLKRLR